MENGDFFVGADEDPFAKGKVLITDLFNSKRNFASCKPHFLLQLTDVEGHPGDDGSSSRVEQHSPECRCRQIFHIERGVFRHFGLDWVLCQHSKTTLSSTSWQCSMHTTLCETICCLFFVQYTAAPEAFRSSGGANFFDHCNARGLQNHIYKKLKVSLVSSRRSVLEGSLFIRCDG